MSQTNDILQVRKSRDCAPCVIGLYAGPDAQFQLYSVWSWCNTSSIIVITRSVLFSLMHQKPSAGRAPPGPAGELERSPRPLAVLGGGMGTLEGGEGGKGKEGEGKGGREEGKGSCNLASKPKIETPPMTSAMPERGSSTSKHTSQVSAVSCWGVDIDVCRQHGRRHCYPL